MKNKLIVAAIVIVAIPLLLLLAWLIMSPGKIRTYSEPNSISDKFVMDINGAPNGFFINSKDINNPILLLVSSGPGTDDYVFTDKYKDMHIEDEFTVVYWDYRYMGIAYNKDFDVDSVNIDNLLNDANTVTEYLKAAVISHLWKHKDIRRIITHTSVWRSALPTLKKTIRSCISS